jgi:hypothetical protein
MYYGGEARDATIAAMSALKHSLAAVLPVSDVLVLPLRAVSARLLQIGLPLLPSLRHNAGIQPHAARRSSHRLGRPLIEERVSSQPQCSAVPGGLD